MTAHGGGCGVGSVALGAAVHAPGGELLLGVEALGVLRLHLGLHLGVGRADDALDPAEEGTEA